MRIGSCTETTRTARAAAAAMAPKGAVTEKKAKSKEEKRQKQESKAAKKEAKQKNKQGGDDDDDDAEFDALVKQLTQRDLQKTAITIERLTAVPTARASFTVNLGGNGELVLFGGELYDGAVSRCFDDVLRFTPSTKPGGGGAWKRIFSENSPPPRCAHCSAATPTHLYVFGGELSSKYQFHHLNDLWRLDLKTNAWTIMPSINGPSPRSGARMVAWRNYLVLFGGFYEASRGVRWHDDLFFFDTRTEKWARAKLDTGPATSRPSARSGFLFAAHPTKPVVYLYGGYAKVAASTASQRGHQLEDLWALHLSVAANAKQGALPDCRWEVLPRRGAAPSKRSGMAACVHRNRLLVFGGVADTETENDVIGEFFNSLHAFDMDRHRWFELGLRGSVNGGGKKRRRAHGGKTDDGQSSAAASRDDGDDDEEDDSEVEDSADVAMGIADDAFYVIVDGKFVRIDAAEEESAAVPPPPVAADAEPTPQPVVAEAPARVAAEAPASSLAVAEAPWGGQPCPIPRMATGVAVLGNRLLVLGGTREEGDKTITLDDVWSMDLSKMDAWMELEAGAWKAQTWAAGNDDDAQSSSSDADGGEGEGDDDDDDDEGGNGVEEPDEEELAEREERAQHVREMTEQIKAMRDEMHVDDEANTPKPHEELRAFFARTCAFWLSELARKRQVDKQRYGEEPERLSGKELRGEAFKLCRRRFDLLQPLLDLLNALEEEQRLAEEAASEEARALAERAVNRGRPGAVVMSNGGKKKG